MQSVGGEISRLPVWLLWPSSVAAVVIANGLGYLVLLAAAVKSGRWERKAMVDHLRPELGTPVVTDEEYAAIEKTGEPPKGDAIRRQIFVAQCNLAKRKAYLAQRNQPSEVDPVAMAWRSELDRMRA
jgi:hypothetical protein